MHAGEDIPNEEILQNDSNLQKKQQTRRTKATTIQQLTLEKYAGIKAALSYCNDQTSLMNLYRQHQNEVENNAEIKALFTERKQQIQAA